MTDPRGPGAPDPNDVPAPAPAQPDPSQTGWAANPGAQLPEAPDPTQPGWAAIPGTQPAATPASDPSQPGWAAIPGAPTPTAPYGEPGVQPVPPPAPAKPASKLRTIIPLVVIAGIIGAVLFATRDNQSAFDLDVGLCFDVPTETSVSTVTKRDCTTPHDAEIFHNAEYSGSTEYPTSITFENFVEETCLPIFGTYVGVAYDDAEDLTVGWFYPTSESWADNDRTVTCYLGRLDEAKLSKSMKGSGGV
jgi:hypothetical protein